MSSPPCWSSSPTMDIADPGDFDLMDLDASEADLSIVEMLIDAPGLPTTRKRSSSCPPTLSSDGPSDFAFQFEDLSMVMPQSDPIEPPVSGILVRDVGAIVGAKREHGITVENAQTILDPQACLFVANLPITVSDQEIQMALTQFLSKDSDCFVKVNRTRGGMPFAHVQYRDAETARIMYDQKNHQMLWNRQLRIEPASATRFLFVGHKVKALGIPTEQDIQSMFHGLKIESIRQPTEEEKKEANVDECLLVNFSKWGECGEALRAYRSHPVYWLKGPKKSELRQSHPAPRSKTLNQNVVSQRQISQFGGVPQPQPFQLSGVSWHHESYGMSSWLCPPGSSFPMAPFPVVTPRRPAFSPPVAKRQKRQQRQLDHLPDLSSSPRPDFSSFPPF